MLSHNLLIMWNKLSKTYKWSFLNLIAVGFAKIIFMGDKLKKKNNKMSHQIYVDLLFSI